jgi:hypothetical protein
MSGFEDGANHLFWLMLSLSAIALYSMSQTGQLPEDPHRWDFNPYFPPRVPLQPNHGQYMAPHMHHSREFVTSLPSTLYVGDPQNGISIGGQLSSHSSPIQPAPYTVKRNYLLPFM